MAIPNDKFGSCFGCRRHVSSFEGFVFMIDGHWRIFCQLCDPPATNEPARKKAKRRQCSACGKYEMITAPATACAACLGAK